MSFHFIVRFEALSGKESEFRAELLTVIEASRAEKGCVSINAYQSLRRTGEFAIHSEWVDEAAFEVHSTLPHTQKFVAAAERLTPGMNGLRSKHIGGGLGAAAKRGFSF